MPDASPVRLICPNLNCRTVLSVPESTRGKLVRCRACRSRVRVPEKGETGRTKTEAMAG